MEPTRRTWLKYLAKGARVKLIREGKVSRCFYIFVRHDPRYRGPSHLWGAQWSVVINSVHREMHVLTNTIVPKHRTTDVRTLRRYQ